MDALRPYQFRGKSRLLSPLAAGGGERSAELFGYRVTLDVGEHIQRFIYLGQYEPAETRLIAGSLRPGMTFVDVGANVGYFSLLAASRVGPTGRVLAIEPSPVAFSRLLRTVQANEISQVTVSCVAVGAESGEMELYVHPPFRPRFKHRYLRTFYPIHSPSLIPQEGWDRVAVPVRPFDEICAEQGIERVDVMKVDVEGFESEVFLGGRRSLTAGRVKALLCEFNEPGLREAGSSAAELARLLQELGFREADVSHSVTAETICNRFFIHRSAGEA